MSYPQPTYHGQPPPPAPRAPRRSVAKTRKSTSHGFHLALTILTGGMWGIFVWAPMILWHKFGPRRRTVTHYR